MLNRKPYSDWATPKPASTRSSPSLNDPLDLIKKGIIKAGNVQFFYAEQPNNNNNDNLQIFQQDNLSIFKILLSLGSCLSNIYSDKKGEKCPL